MSATARRAVTHEEPAAALDAAAAPSAAKHQRNVLVLSALLAAALIGLGTHALLTRGQERTDNAYVEADVVPLNIRVGGQVLHVHVQDDAYVHRGDVLVELDPREYLYRVQQAEAELDSARAQTEVSEAEAVVAEAAAKGVHSSARAAVSASKAAASNAEAEVSVARAALARMQAEAHRAVLEFDRTQRLRNQNLVSQAELNNAQAAHDAAQAALAGARAQVAAAEQARQAGLSRVDEAAGQRDQSAPVSAKIAAARAAATLARARMKVAQAALKQAQLTLEQTRVLAPVDGHVSKLSVREGQTLLPGQPVAQLVPLQTYLIANFKETQVGSMRSGQPVEVQVDAFPGRKLKGRVVSLAGGTGARFSLLPPDNATGNFVKVVQRVPVRIAWESLPEGLPLRAGLSAEVTVFTRSWSDLSPANSLRKTTPVK